MQTKEIYASMEFIDEELRVVVGEFHMSRLNVLKAQRLKMSGIADGKIVDMDGVTAAISRSFLEIEKSIGYRIKNVIISIPSDKVKCVKRRINVPISEGSKRIRLSHAKLGLNKILDSFDSDDYEFVNIGAIKYTNGGISSRQVPIDEQSDYLTMDVDLLVAEKQLVYSYVSAVEASGHEVLDICLDAYAIAEESAILENSMNKYVVLNYFEKYSTRFTLFYKGSVVGSEKINYGYEKMIKAVKRKYRLDYNEALKLVKDLSLYQKDEINDSIVFMYMDHNERCQITRRDLYECVKDDFMHWISDVNEMNLPIIENGETKMVISGSGADIVGMNALIEENNFNCDSSLYIPDVIGVRKGCYSVALGAIYAHKKWAELRDMHGCSYESIEDKKINSNDKNEFGFTTKLKKILLSDK